MDINSDIINHLRDNEREFISFLKKTKYKGDHKVQDIYVSRKVNKIIEELGVPVRTIKYLPVEKICYVNKSHTISWCKFNKYFLYSIFEYKKKISIGIHCELLNKNPTIELDLKGNLIHSDDVSKICTSKPLFQVMRNRIDRFNPYGKYTPRLVEFSDYSKKRAKTQKYIERHVEKLPVSYTARPSDKKTIKDKLEFDWFTSTYDDQYLSSILKNFEDGFELLNVATAYMKFILITNFQEEKESLFYDPSISYCINKLYNKKPKNKIILRCEQ